MVLIALGKSQPSGIWRGVPGRNLPFRRNLLSVFSGRRINITPEDVRITLFLKCGKLLPHNKTRGNGTPYPTTSETPVSDVGGLPPTFGVHSDMKYISPRGTQTQEYKEPSPPPQLPKKDIKNRQLKV
jgi:hypothetical protein